MTIQLDIERLVQVARQVSFRFAAHSSTTANKSYALNADDLFGVALVKLAQIVKAWESYDIDPDNMEDYVVRATRNAILDECRKVSNSESRGSNIGHQYISSMEIHTLSTFNVFEQLLSDADMWSPTGSTSSRRPKVDSADEESFIDSFFGIVNDLYGEEHSFVLEELLENYSPRCTARISRDLDINYHKVTRIRKDLQQLYCDLYGDPRQESYREVQTQAPS